MRIIGINGSPRPKGSTAFLLERILHTAGTLGAETRLFHAGTLLAEAGGTPFCTVCSNPCSGMCYKGTTLENAYAALQDADAVILGSPVYFGTVSGQLKAFFDKTRMLRMQKGLYNTVGAGVTVAASKYGGQETAMRALHDIMLVHGMILVGDGHADADCGHHGVCAHRPASEDTAAQHRADILARRLVEVCLATDTLRHRER
jgi:multimeric flavodoxin WrbA